MAQQISLQNLVGSYRLAAFEFEHADGKIVKPFGDHPTGAFLVSANGRMAAIITADGATPAKNEAEAAALHRRTIAYSGKFTLDGATITILPDISWNIAWNGVAQVRHLNLANGRLSIETAPQPSPMDGNQIVVARLVWHREN